MGDLQASRYNRFTTLKYVLGSKFVVGYFCPWNSMRNV